MLSQVRQQARKYIQYPVKMERGWRRNHKDRCQYKCYRKHQVNSQAILNHHKILRTLVISEHYQSKIQRAKNWQQDLFLWIRGHQATLKYNNLVNLVSRVKLQTQSQVKSYTGHIKTRKLQKFRQVHSNKTKKYLRTLITDKSSTLRVTKIYRQSLALTFKVVTIF